MKKRIFVIILSLVTAIGLSVLCFAHSGRTDSNGGHYNRSTGEYHYHHGYPAHQHVNGVCPYTSLYQTSTTSKETETQETQETQETEKIKISELGEDLQEYLKKYGTITKEEYIAQIQQEKTDATSETDVKKEIPEIIPDNKIYLDVTYGISVYIDGERAYFTDSNGMAVMPFVHDGTAYVPLKSIAKLLGCEVTYQASDNSSRITTSK